MKVNGYTIHPIALALYGPMAQITQHANSEAHDRLLIADMATTDEGAHTPAASVTIFGRPALLSLRDKLVEIYPLPATDNGPLVQQRDELLSVLQDLSRHFTGKWVYDTRDQSEIDAHRVAAEAKALALIAKATPQEGGAA